MKEPLWTLLVGLMMACGGQGLTPDKAKEIFPDGKVAELASAACVGDADRIQRALAGGADIEGRGQEGFTPLIWAMNCRNLEGVRLLLARGADPDARMDDGASAMWLAATYKDPRFLKALAEAGGDMNGTEEHWDTSALMGGMTSGFQNGTWENYYFALESGADINRRYGRVSGTTIAEKAVGLALFDKAVELVERGYNNDLERLERFASSRPVDANSKQAAFKRLLLERIAERKKHAI